MRLSDLLKLEAVDRSGRPLGLVTDVRLERRGAEWEVTAIVVGDAAFADRLGFVYGDVHKPALLKLVVRRLTRNARVAPWDVVTVKGDTIIVERDADELDGLREIGR